MGFANGRYATVWSVEDKGNYVRGRISTSRKNKKSGEYEQDFGDFVSFVGEASRKLARTLQERDRIRIEECEVTNTYDKSSGKTYYNNAIYSFQKVDGNEKPNSDGGNQPAKQLNYTVPAPSIDNDLPF